MYTGTKYVSEDTSDPWLFHINGNAIYHVGDEDWRAFIKDVRLNPSSSSLVVFLHSSVLLTFSFSLLSALPGALTRPFDVTIYEYRRTRFLLSQRIIHKFIYIEYIQNWGVSGYSLSQLLTERPHTFLVHKKHECPECDPVTD